MRALLFSGGLDSTVVFYKLLKELGPDGFVAVTIFYGQPHYKEVDRARKTAEDHGVEWVLLNARDVFRVKPSGLLDENCDDSVASETVVKNRNGLFVAMVSAFASEIYLGCNKDDYADYYDCRPEYLSSLWIPFDCRTSVPLRDYTKKQVIEEARELGIDLSSVLSCYRGTNCGSCAACLLIKEAT